jgi:hypothetical protein
VVSNRTYAYGGRGERVASFVDSMTLTTNVTFEGVVNENNVLLTATAINNAE